MSKRRAIVRPRDELRAWALLALVALGLRLVWIPAHLAFEAHLETDLSHASDARGDHDHHHDHDLAGHRHDGEHGEDHDPHPASDHEAEPFSAPSPTALALLWNPEFDEPLVVVREASPGQAEPRAPVPRGRLPASRRTRAPPIC